MSTHATERPRPPLPLKTRFLLAVATSYTDASRRSNGTVNRWLFSLFDPITQANPTPIDGISSADHTIDAPRSLWARLFSPVSTSDKDPLPVIVYFHGGGFAFHSAATSAYDAFCRRLARHIPARVLSVEYRLAPEHRYPAQCDDGVDVLRWLDSFSLIPDVSAVFLAGDSAGGNIAHHVACRLMPNSETMITFNRIKLAGVVAIQPFFGGETPTESEKQLEGAPLCLKERFEWMWRAFLPVGSNRDHEAANVFGPGCEQPSSGNWSRYPPTMVLVGGWDALQDRQRSYAEGLKRVGVENRLVEYPDAIHAFYLFPEFSDATKMLNDVADFVNEMKDVCYT